jgi:hypothetical protein
MQRRKQQTVNTHQVSEGKPTIQPQTCAVEAQQKAQAAPPASRTRLKTIGASNAAHRRFDRMENEVQQALAVMDREACKLLNYCQLMRHP